MPHFTNGAHKYGCMQIEEAKRLRDLEAENSRLKKVLTEAHLNIEALKVGFGVKHLPRNASARRSGACSPCQGWRHGCRLEGLPRNTYRYPLVRSEHDVILS